MVLYQTDIKLTTQESNITIRKIIPTFIILLISEIQYLN